MKKKREGQRKRNKRVRDSQKKIEEKFWWSKKNIIESGDRKRNIYSDTDT